MRKKHTVLAVDDEARVLQSVKRVFIDDANLEILTTDDPIEALDIVRKRDIDLLLVDQQMPAMKGTELLARALRIRADIITMVLTGYSDVEVILNAINEVGVYKFLLKPWRNEDLYWTIVRALENREVVETNKLLSSEIKKRDRFIQNLEEKHPGITKVERNEFGVVLIDET